MRNFRSIHSNILLDICEVFLAKEEAGAGSEPEVKDRRTEDVARRANAIWEEREVEMRISREDVYAAILEARRRDLFRLAPPSHESLQAALCERFGRDREHLQVVATESRHPEHVGIAAADLIFQLIRRVAEQRSEGRVHLGFGAGWTTRVVAYQLALTMQTELDVPPLGLRAVSSGFAADHAHTAPVTYFGFFEGVSRDIKEVGMFGPPYVREREHPATIARLGVKEAFDEKAKIDIVMTSLASAADPHSGLRRVAEKVGSIDKLEARHWVGDVQNLPYSATGPIKKVGHRAVTLFELDELREMAKRRNKHVVLVSPPCPECGRTRARALLPLLTQKPLEVWTHLVTDIPTARELLALS
jgi:DNA-binding transcriptional regulator LsrR (DeoR family)